MKRNALAKFISFIVVVLLIVIFFTSYLVFFAFFDKNNYSNIVNEEGTLIFGNFKSYQNQVYVYTDNNRYYLVEDADLETFTEVSDLYSPSVAKDKNYVYCGNKIVPYMNPSKVKAIGSNYYTDGKNTYYLSQIAEKTREINKVEEVYEIIKSKITNYEIPQTYNYNMLKLEDTSKEYYTILNNLILTDGDKAYFRGKLMKNVNVQTLSRLPLIYEDKIEESYDYFTDGNNVYYHEKLMDLKYNKDIITIGDIFSDNYYLYDSLSENLYFNDKLINKECKIDKIITTYDRHINHTLFLNKDGIYFYYMKKDMFKKAGENPFLSGEFKEISPFVFSDGKEILYLDSYKKAFRNKGNNVGATDYLSTTINKVNNIEIKSDFSKIKDVFYGGSIWKNGNDFYYFDNIGQSYLSRMEDYWDIKSFNNLKNIILPIYRIKDEQVLDVLLEKDDTAIGEFIRNLIDEEKLVPVDSTILVEARTYYDYMRIRMIFTKIVLTFIVLLCLVLVFQYIMYIKSKNDVKKAVKEYEKTLESLKRR